MAALPQEISSADMMMTTGGNGNSLMNSQQCNSGGSLQCIGSAANEQHCSQNMAEQLQHCSTNVTNGPQHCNTNVTDRAQSCNPNMTDGPQLGNPNLVDGLQRTQHCDAVGPRYNAISKQEYIPGMEKLCSGQQYRDSVGSQQGASNMRSSIYFQQSQQYDSSVHVKKEPIDEYEFVDDPVVTPIENTIPPSLVAKLTSQKKRGRPKGSLNKNKRERKDAIPRIKIKNELSYDSNQYNSQLVPVKKEGQTLITDTFKVRKKRDRFDGIPQEEIEKRVLPDHLAPNLDILIIGINPGLFAAYKGHHYAGPGNHFWKCLYLSGLIPEPMNAMDDYKLIQHGIGFTNIVERCTKGSADLKRQEIREGGELLLCKIRSYKPKIAAFNGKGIYEIYSGVKLNQFGKQPHPIEGTNTVIYVMPSSSARCAQLPRAIDKVPFYMGLKKLRDYLCGRRAHLDETDIVWSECKLGQFENGNVKLKAEPLDDDVQVKQEPGENVENTGCPKKKRKRRTKAEMEADRARKALEKEQQFQHQMAVQNVNLNMNGPVALPPALPGSRLLMCDVTHDLHDSHDDEDERGLKDLALESEHGGGLDDLALDDFQKDEVTIRQEENPLSSGESSLQPSQLQQLPNITSAHHLNTQSDLNAQNLTDISGRDLNNMELNAPKISPQGMSGQEMSSQNLSVHETGATELRASSIDPPDWKLRDDQIEKELQEMIAKEEKQQQQQGKTSADNNELAEITGKQSQLNDSALDHATNEKIGEKTFNHFHVKQETTWDDDGYGLSDASISHATPTSQPSFSLTSPTYLPANSTSSAPNSNRSTSPTASQPTSPDFLGTAYSSLPGLKSDGRPPFLNQNYESGMDSFSAAYGMYPSNTSALGSHLTTTTFNSPSFGTPSFTASQRSVLSPPFANAHGYSNPTYIDSPNPGSTFSSSFLGMSPHQKEYSLHAAATGSFSRAQSMISPHLPSYSHNPNPLYLPHAGPHSTQMSFPHNQYPGYPHPSNPAHSLYPAGYPTGMYGPETGMTSGYYGGGQMAAIPSMRMKQEPSYFGHCPY